MNQKEKTKLKALLKETCERMLEQRIQTAENAMKSAQESANSSEKSSAGDKYETSRAMGQLDSDMNSKQLEEARKELVWFRSIDMNNPVEKVASGAVVTCGNRMFFIAVGLGELSVDEKKIILLSPKAPFAVMMNGMKAGDRFTFNKTDFEITEIF